MRHSQCKIKGVSNQLASLITTHEHDLQLTVHALSDLHSPTLDNLEATIIAGAILPCRHLQYSRDDQGLQGGACGAPQWMQELCHPGQHGARSHRSIAE